MPNVEKEKLDEMLSKIQSVIEMYNSINQGDELVLTKKEKKDVRNMFICVYNDRHVGLFRKINWSTRKIYRMYWDAEYDAGSIYFGVDSNYIGMKKTHEGSSVRNYWLPIGTKEVLDGKSYVSNCTMQNGMSFDDMRLIMYKNGQIGPYEIGEATSIEMVEVLKYALTYYGLDSKPRSSRR